MYTVTERQFYDAGEFSSIYKVSPTRIVKIYHKLNRYTEKERDFMIADEIYGGTLNYGLPVIKKITVMMPGCTCGDCDPPIPAKALVKRFIPFIVTEDECYSIINRPDFPIELKWDGHPRQMRKDQKGRIYVIDTQTEKIMHIVCQRDGENE